MTTMTMTAVMTSDEEVVVVDSSTPVDLEVDVFNNVFDCKKTKTRKHKNMDFDHNTQLE